MSKPIPIHDSQSKGVNLYEVSDGVYKLRWRATHEPKESEKAPEGSQMFRGTRSEAIQKKRLRAAELGLVTADKRFQSVNPFALKQRAPLVGLVDAFKSHITARSCKRNKKGKNDHAEQMGRYVVRCSEICGLEFLDQFQSEDLDKVVLNWPTTTGGFRYLKALKEFSIWASSKYVPTNAFKGFKFRNVKRFPHRSLKESEQQLLLSNAQPFDPIAESFKPKATRGSDAHKEKISFCRRQKKFHALRGPLSLGLRYANRPGEMCSLLVGNWNAQTMTLTIPPNIAKIEIEEKSSTPFRMLVVDPFTADVITQAAGNRPPGDPLFLTSTGRKWDSKWLCKAFKQYAAHLGISAKAYDIRHTAATTLCRNHKGDLALVRTMLGHTSESTEVMRYLHMSLEEDHIDAVAKRFSSIPLIRDDHYTSSEAENDEAHKPLKFRTGQGEPLPPEERAQEPQPPKDNSSSA